tara:strand:- start:94056 stop:94433 length:378 start_codon:yes stop_codon:yes gene_type:complete
MDNNLQIFIRNIIIEKLLENSEYDILTEIDNFYKEIFDEIELKQYNNLSRKYFMKDKEFYMEYDVIQNRLICKYSGFSEIIEKDLGFTYDETISILKKMIKERFIEDLGISDEIYNEMLVMYINR